MAPWSKLGLPRPVTSRVLRSRLRRWPGGPDESRGRHSRPSRRHRLHDSVKRVPHATLAAWQALQARFRGCPSSVEHSSRRRLQRAHGRSSAHAVLDARQCVHAWRSERLLVDPEPKAVPSSASLAFSTTRSLSGLFSPSAAGVPGTFSVPAVCTAAGGLSVCIVRSGYRGRRAPRRGSRRQPQPEMPYGTAFPRPGRA